MPISEIIIFLCVNSLILILSFGVEFYSLETNTYYLLHGARVDLLDDVKNFFCKFKMRKSEEKIIYRNIFLQLIID